MPKPTYFQKTVLCQPLSLYDCEKITDTGLEHLKGLTSLEILGLNGTKITDGGLGHLKGLTSLTKLFLYNTKVTDAGLSEIKAALPNCRLNNE